ncbi:MAG: hypothetical protein Q9201_004043 [Fulgogasparrea decipioides]
MWTALLAQLQQYECLWIDQLCITQSSESEKTAAIGSMDLVYKSARKVVVVLEDIAFSHTDVDLMLRYANNEPTSREVSEIELDKLAAAFVKIVTARWSDRAWCLHEFLMGRRHVFLVPIWHIDRPPITNGPSITVISIDGSFLSQIGYVFIQQNIKHQNTASDCLLNIKDFSGIGIDKIRRFYNRLRALEVREVFGSDRPLEDGSFMHMFHEVFSHKALHNADKVSIILNTMRSGLYLKAPSLMTEKECLWLITVVAMAAGDATTLTTNGPQSIDSEGQFDKDRQWLSVPSSGDQARRTGYRTIPRTHIDAKVVRDGIELDMLFFGTNLALKSPSQHYLSIARWLIDHRGLCEMSIHDQEMRLDTEADETVYSQLRVSYIQALACALACGKDWMLAYHTKSYVTLPGGLDLQWDRVSREVYSQAIDWGLATVIEQDIGADLSETWQDSGTLMWADSVTKMQEDNTKPDLAETIYGELGQEENHWYSILLDITETLVNFGLAIFPESDGSEVGREEWSVQICNIPEVSKFLVYVPSAGTQERFHLGVPKALFNDEYSWMSRLWLLRAEKSGHLPYSYSLGGKSRLAGISPLPEVPGMRVTVVDDGQQAVRFSQ